MIQGQDKKTAHQEVSTKIKDNIKKREGKRKNKLHNHHHRR